jgi:hypothetical protein
VAALNDVDEILRAHAALRPAGPGAPPIVNGARVGTSLLRAATTLLSSAIQTEVEETFKEALPLTFDHFSPNERADFWESTCKGWGNPNPANIKRLFFRIGFPDVLSGLRWQKCTNDRVRDVLDTVNQVRNRVAHGQPVTVNGHAFRLTRPVVSGWRNFAGVFIQRFRPFVLEQYDEDE